MRKYARLSFKLFNYIVLYFVIKDALKSVFPSIF